MFDADYFREGLRKQVEEAGGNPVVKVVLHAGREYLVRDVVQTAPGYVMLNVYPPEETAGIVAPSSSAYSTVPQAGYHPTAVAYEAIAQVYVSNTTSEMRRRIGFIL